MANEVPKAELMIDIINKNLSVEDVKKRISELETEYGEDYFFNYDIEEAGIERKPKEEWDEDYYEFVKTKGINGIASKPYFLYFAELNQYIHNKRLEEKKKQQQKKTTKIIAAAIAIVCIVLLLVWANFSGADAAASISEVQCATDDVYNIQEMLFDI